MREDAEPRQPARKQTRDSVRHRNVELRQPSLAEAHQEDGCGGNGDGDDGYGTHSFVRQFLRWMLDLFDGGGAKLRLLQPYCSQISPACPYNDRTWCNA